MSLEFRFADNNVERRIGLLDSENAVARMFGRDAAFWGGDAERQRSVANRLGWLDVAAHMRERVPEIEAFASRAADDGFHDAVVLGMGGSSLAPEVMRQTFGERKGCPRLHVLDTTDPATILALTGRIDAARTLFFVSSKSGTTVEALSLFAYFHELVSNAKPDRAGENFVAITDEATPLEALAREHGFLQIFGNPGDIGGRYSALSLFGLVPGAVAGVDIAKLLDRAIAERDLEHRSANGAALSLGAALGQLALDGRNKCTFIVSRGIASFGLWVEQLVAESTGKLGRGILPVAGEPLGTPRHYGDDRMFVQLRLEADSTGEDDAAVGALVAEGQPVIVIDLEDRYDLGRECFRWEFAVAVAGHVLEINPFDEPNVQESKDNTGRVLKEFEASGQLDIAAIDSAASPVALSVPGRISERGFADSVAGLLGAIDEHDYFAVTAYIAPTPHADAVFADIRAAVRDATRASTTLGYGPRFLHSTGQLHKGGPPQGVFLQVTASDVVDVPIPGRPFTFSQLKRAQSLGDFQSLAAHGRPVLRVHLGHDINGGLDALRTAVLAAVESRSAARR